MGLFVSEMGHAIGLVVLSDMIGGEKKRSEMMSGIGLEQMCLLSL